ncbi:TPA: hypothetical protein ACGOY9_000993 [Streptococcus suis]
MRYLGKILLLVSVLFLIACHKLEKGEVIEKYERKAYTTFVHTGKVLVPIVHPRTWNIKIRGEYKGEERTETYSVTENYYEQVDVGDVLDVSEVERND